jgi:hypothetical protein
MTRDEQLLRYYRRRVEMADKLLAQMPAEQRRSVDFDNAYWHERTILQRLLEKAGVPICYGAVDYVEPPTTTCVGTRHSTCPNHAYSCYLCVSLGDASDEA